MKLTPRMLEACYNFLRTTLPFKRWKLPEGKEVEFRVGRSRKDFGNCWIHPKRGHYIVRVSGNRVFHVLSLAETVAHEMIHLHRYQEKETDAWAEHDAEFWRLAKAVCRHHDFDLAEF